MDDRQLKPEDFESKGGLQYVAAKIVLKCLYLASVGRPELMWNDNSLARCITKWNKACGKRLVCDRHATCANIHHERHTHAVWYTTDQLWIARRWGTHTSISMMHT